MQSIIKWIGSKRVQAKEIVRYFPKYIDTYYEPFCGGCYVMHELLMSDDHFANKIVCSDVNGDLIDLWNAIKRDCETVFSEYERMWNEMNKLDKPSTKRQYYEMIRDEFNQNRSPYLFFFLMRTCTNGIPRYNRFGQFNNTFHLTRKGINPNRLKKFLFDWRDAIDNENIEFRKCDYNVILDGVGTGDFIYLDPPYELTRDTGRYFGTMNHVDLFDRLRILNQKGIKWALSYDGGENTPDYVFVPNDCYENQISIMSMNGGYRKTRQFMSNDCAYESLYIN